MATKKNKISKKHKNSKNSKKHKNSKKNITQKGGYTDVDGPVIKYTKNKDPNAFTINLKCLKCSSTKFKARTLTMGSKIKSLISFEVIDNRFKVFTCKGCGFVQVYSNNITCDEKDCD